MIASDARLRALLAAALLALVAPTAFGEGERVVKQAALPAAQATVVVAEGGFEPRSIGSYSVRAYDARDPRHPYDRFLAGAVRPRNGSVEELRFADVDRDGIADIIVVMRAAGTGGYRSADAFRLRGRALVLLGSVSGLAKDADPVRALAAGLAAGRSTKEPKR
ncbi:MAG TPA: PliI family lysozyme inhibitor of I-type lysozyme [Burkholderiales bacterium]